MADLVEVGIVAAVGCMGDIVDHMAPVAAVVVAALVAFLLGVDPAAAAA